MLSNMRTAFLTRCMADNSVSSSAADCCDFWVGASREVQGTSISIAICSSAATGTSSIMGIVGRLEVLTCERYVGGLESGWGGNVISTPVRTVLALERYVGGGELGRL